MKTRIGIIIFCLFGSLFLISFNPISQEVQILGITGTPLFLPLVMRPANTPTFTPTPTATMTPVSRSVDIVSSSAYTSTWGTLYIVGEAINNTSDNVTDVRITATLLNSNGSVIRVDYSYTLIDVLAPGQKAPFKISFSSYPAEYVSYQLIVSYMATTQPAKTNMPVLSSTTWTSSYGTLYTVGEVQNNTGRSAEFVKVVVTYYDAGGIVTDAEYTYTMVDILSHLNFARNSGE